MAIKILSSKSIYQNPHVNIMVDTVEQDGHQWEQAYFVKENKDGVVILPIDDTGIYMVNQYRHAIAEFIWQFPMGSIRLDQSPLDAAVAELSEETGIQAEHITPIGTYKPEPAMTSTLMHVYLATGLSFHPSHSDVTEVGLKMRHFTFAQIDQMIHTGQANCGYTMSAYFLFKEYKTNDR